MDIDHFKSNKPRNQNPFSIKSHQFSPEIDPLHKNPKNKSNCRLRHRSNTKLEKKKEISNENSELNGSFKGEEAAEEQKDTY